MGFCFIWTFWSGSKMLEEGQFGFWEEQEWIEMLLA